MGDNYVQLSDTISGTEGKGYITINGVNRELFEVSAFEAYLEMIVQERRMMGHRMTQHKVIGATGTGSITLYFMNSDMLKMAQNYIKNGKYKGVKIQVKNEDSQSTIGKQEVVLSNVIFSKLLIAKLDDQSEDPITFDTDFTFDDMETLSFFDLPANYR